MNLNLNPREIVAAAPDGLALQMGIPVKNPHPFARDVSLSSLAHACGKLAPNYRAGSRDMAVMGQGIATSDYSRLLSDGLRALVSQSFQAKAEHLRFSVVVPVSKLGEPIDQLGAIDPNIELQEVGELSEISSFLAPTPAAGVPGTPDALNNVPGVILKTYARIVRLSREAVINDDLRSFSNFTAQLGVSGARLESRFVVEALESSPTLDDGEPLFDVLNGNVLASAFGADKLGQAMALLRKQLLPSGERADLAGRHLVVSAALEMAARTAVLDAGLSTEVTVMAELPDARWFLLADQQVQPVVGVLRLFGASNPTMVEPASRTALKAFDGTGVRVRADLGAVLLSRVGIVRGGV